MRFAVEEGQKSGKIICGGDWLGEAGISGLANTQGMGPAMIWTTRHATHNDLWIK